MKTMLNITRNDLQIFFAERSNLISLVVLPLAFTLVLGWAFGGSGGEGPQRVRVDLLDVDDTPLSANFAEELRTANETLVLCPQDNDEDNFCRLDQSPLGLEEALERVKAETTEALIVIPDGYARSLSEFDPFEIQIYASGNPALPHPVEQTVGAVLQKINTASLAAAVTDSLLARLSEQVEISTFIAPHRAELVQMIYTSAREQTAAQPNLVQYTSTTGAEAVADSGFGQSVPGMGSMYVMFTVLGGTVVLWRERRQWTLQRLAAMPISHRHILGGKILTYFTLGMTQFLVVFAVGLFVGLDFGTRPLLVLPTMIAFVLCITALAFAIAPAVTSEQQGAGVARLLALTLAPLGGAWWPLDIVPDFMRAIARLSPVSWAMTAFHDVMYYSGGLSEILPEIAVLTGAAAVLFLIGVNRFRYSA